MVTLEQVTWINIQKNSQKYLHVNLLIILNCIYLFQSISFMLIKINHFTGADVSGHVKFQISQLWNQWLLSSQLHVRFCCLITKHNWTPFTAREVALQHFCHTWHFQALTNSEMVVNETVGTCSSSCRNNVPLPYLTVSSLHYTQLILWFSSNTLPWSSNLQTLHVANSTCKLSFQGSCIKNETVRNNKKKNLIKSNMNLIMRWLRVIPDIKSSTLQMMTTRRCIKVIEEWTM